MAIKTVLIIGGSGFVGTQLALSLRDQHRIFATYHSRPYSIPGICYVPFALDSKNWIKRLMYTVRPDVIIYALGSNSLKNSEQYPKISESIHSVGPASLTSANEVCAPRFIYISNSYVFDGRRGNYSESDTPLPSNILGKVKLGGENMVRSKYFNFLIIRSSPLFGRGTPWNYSFLDYLRSSLTKNQRIELPSQEVHSFAPASGLCNLMSRVIESEIRGKVLHYGGLTKLSTYEFAKNFAKRFKFDSNLIIPKKTLQTKASNSEDFFNDFSLNTTQTVQMLKIKPFLLEEGFDLIEKNLITGL